MGLLYTALFGFWFGLACWCAGIFCILTIIGAPLGFALITLGTKYMTLPQRHWL